MSEITEQDPAPDPQPPRPGKQMQAFDRSTKRIFMFKAMVADVLRVLLTPKCANLLDFSRLTQGSPEQVPEDGGPSINDSAWSVPTKAGDTLVTFLFEFQWNIDPTMASRVLAACSKKVENLEMVRKADSCEQVHLIVPVVVYLGPGRWTAGANLRDTGLIGWLHPQVDSMQPLGQYMLMEMQAHRGPRLRLKRNFCSLLLRAFLALENGDSQGFDREMIALQELGLKQGEEALSREAMKWITLLLEGVGAIGKGSGRLTTRRKSDMKSDMDVFRERFPDINVDFRKEGREEGLKQGREQGLEEGREEGLERGLVKGRKELLVDLCQKRFGEQAASTLGEIIEPVKSLAKLHSISYRLFECDDADEFLDVARAA